MSPSLRGFKDLAMSSLISWNWLYTMWCSVWMLHMRSVIGSWLCLLGWYSISGWTIHLFHRRVLLYHNMLSREVPVMMVLVIARKVWRIRRVSMRVANRLMFWIVFWYSFFLTLWDIFPIHLCMLFICVSVYMVPFSIIYRACSQSMYWFSED